MDWHDTLISLFLYICQKYKNELYFYCKDFFFSVLRSEKGSCRYAGERINCEKSTNFNAYNNLK